MRRFLLTFCFLLWFAHVALALPSYCTLTGTVLAPDGTPCAACKVTITTAGNQEVGGSSFPGGKFRSWTTESDGTLPAGVEVARTLVVKIQIDKGATVTVSIPDVSTTDISSLLLEPIDVPSSTNINSLSGQLVPGKLKATNSPTDEYCYTYEATGATGEWQVCGSGGSGNSFETWDTPSGTDIVADSSTDTVQFLATGIATVTGGGAADTITIGAVEVGDISAVGDCSTGDCFNGTTGNSLQFEGSTANGFETALTATDPTADRTITMPNRSGQMALERTINLYDYAACNGTDESTAIQSAITAACALGPGGTLYVPADSCFFATTLTGCSGLAIVGSDVTERAAYVTTQPHELVYTGTTVGLDFGGLAGVRLEGIRVQASNASFSSGTLLDIDGSSYVYLDRVNLVAPNLAGAATSKLLYANDVVGLWITGSIFDRGGYSIYGRALSSNYSNVVSIKDTVFYRAEVCSVMNPGDTWDVSSSWWQQQGAASDESYHWCHDTGICMRSLNFSGNMSVDQPASPTNAEFTFCGSGLNISGNFIGGGGTQDGILFDEACDGCSVTGNWFGFLDEALSFSGTGVTGSTIDVTGNGYTTVTSVTSSTRPTRSIMQEATNSYWNDPADIYLNVDTNANSGAGALVVGSNATSSSATHQYDFTEAYANWRRGNDLRFYETDDTNYVQLSAPTLSGDYTLTLPVDDGNSNEVLATNGSGTLSWASNIATATALASNPSDCASDTYATTIAASGNLTCASITNASTTGTATNTPSTLVLRDGSGNFAAGTITAALTGNASTATALAANPADCGADTYATTIAASGALTCATVTNAGLAGSIAVSKTLATGGAGIDINTNDFVTDSSETSFLANSTSLPGTCGEGAVYQDTDSGGTETYVCTAANTWTKTIAATDNVATATALASNPSDCGADTYATTIAASGNLTCSTVSSAGIADGAIVNADINASAAIALSKLANMSTDRLLGRDTASSGAIEELTVGGGIEFTGSGGIQRSAFSGGDVTASAGSGTLSIATGAIVNADINAAAAIDVSKTALAAGFGLDLSGNSLSVNGTEWTGPQVWGDGSGTMSWTFNAGVADPIIDFYGDGTVDVTGALKINTVPVVTESGTQTLTSKTLTSPTVNTPQLNLTNSTTPSPTAEGRVEWDSDTHILAVGNGGSTSYAASGDSTGAATLLASNVVSSGKVQDGTLAANDMTEGFISSYAGTGLTTDTGTSPDTLKIANDGITEAMLKAVDAPSDEECLTYEATGGDFEWQACGSGGGITGLTGDSGGTTTGSTVTLTGGAGITTTRSSDTVTVATASTEQDFLAQSASLSCAGTTPGKLIVDTTTQTLSYCPTGSTTTKYAALGDDNGRATFINATSCTNGVQTASDGTPSCLSAASTPEYVARTMTAGATVAAYAVVMADGSDDDEVIEATTSTTQILGCSQSGSSVTSTNPLSVAVAGVARCKADATVTAGSLVKLGATGEFALATTAEKTWGRAVTDDDGAGSAYVLLFDGAEGTIDHALDLWTSIPDLTSNTLSIINANPTVSMTSTGTLNGVNFAPAFTTSGIGLLTGFNFQPTYSHSSLVSQLYGFNMVGTYTSTDGSGALAASIMRNNATYTSSTANAEPFSSLIAVDDKPVISNTTATTSTSTPTTYITVNHAPVISINDADGATGGLAAMTLTDDIGFRMGGTYTETSGTLAVTNRIGFQYNEVTNTSTATAITNNIGVDIAALGAAGATNNIGIRNADTTVYTPTTQTVVASDTIAPTASLVCLNAAANRDMTSTPHISDGVDGQVLTVMNCDTGTDTIELNDQANVASSGLQLAGNSDVILSPGQSITLVYTSAGGASDWFEIARTAPFQNIKSIVIKSDVTQVNYFCGPGFDCNATETNVDVRIPTDITVVGLSCEQKDDTSCTVAFTVRDDASNTSATCTTTNADVCNWNGSVAIAANSMIDIQLTSWTSCSNNSDIECAVTYKVP